MIISQTDEASHSVAAILPPADATMEELEQWIVSLGGRELSAEEIRAWDEKVARGAKHLNECPFDAIPATARVAETPRS